MKLSVLTAICTVVPAFNGDRKMINVVDPEIYRCIAYPRSSLLSFKART